MGCLHQVDIKRRSLTWYTARTIAPFLWRWGRIRNPCHSLALFQDPTCSRKNLSFFRTYMKWIELPWLGGFVWWQLKTLIPLSTSKEELWAYLMHFFKFLHLASPFLCFIYINGAKYLYQFSSTFISIWLWDFSLNWSILEN